MLKAGVYCIENIYNGKLYIGSAFDAHARILAHFRLLRRNKSHNKHLQASYNKHGKDAFIGYIIELCEKDIVKEKEQFWIDNTTCLTNGYNKSGKVIDNSGWNHKQEYKDRLSKERMGVGNPAYGKKMPAEVIDGIRKRSTGRSHTKESIDKMIAKREENKANYLGSKCGKAKLTEEKVYEIKLKLLQKIPHPTIAKEYNVSPVTIGGIAQNRRWRHVQLKTA